MLVSSWMSKRKENGYMLYHCYAIFLLFLVRDGAHTARLKPGECFPLVAPVSVHMACLLSPDTDGVLCAHRLVTTLLRILMVRLIIDGDWKPSLTKSSSSKIGHTV